MAIPFAQIAQGVGALAGSGGVGGGNSQYGTNTAGGIGYKLLGAPGDPGGALVDLFTNRLDRKRAMKEQKREFDIAMELERERAKADSYRQGQAFINQNLMNLANWRSNALQTQLGRSFRNDLLKAIS